MATLEWPPSPCPWCLWRPKMSMPHLQGCPSYSARPEAHEVAPGLFVGSIEARTSPRWAAVVGILSEENIRWCRSVPQTEAPLYSIEHTDREPGLLAKAPPAWAFLDAHRAKGPVLIHCHQGASRSVAVMVGYLMQEGRPLADALRLVVEARPAAVHLWRGFVEELRALEAGG